MPLASENVTPSLMILFIDVFVFSKVPGNRETHNSYKRCFTLILIFMPLVIQGLSFVRLRESLTKGKLC